MRKILSKKELAEVKFETTEDFLARGGKITVLKPYKPDIKTLFGKMKNRNSPKKRGIMK